MKTAINIITIYFLFSCTSSEEPNHMVKLLQQLQSDQQQVDNFFNNEVRVNYYDSLVKQHPDELSLQFYWGKENLRAGHSAEAAKIFSELIKRDSAQIELDPQLLQLYHGIAYFRLGEQQNCLDQHNPASCLLPINDDGIHQVPHGSQQAIRVWNDYLSQMNEVGPEFKWLLNLSYMTLGQMQEIPETYQLPAEVFETEPVDFYFEDIGMEAGVSVNALSGGSILDDFNGDGYLDIAASSWNLTDQLQLFINRPGEGFTEVSQSAGLEGITGGLNIMQTDYNNDGWLDIFILRGAWLESHGKHPNSLLRNNGPNAQGQISFTDVTVESGLLSFHPGQTATWADFNNDGWLDVFIGNESKGPFSGNACQLYINHQGSFENQAHQSQVRVNRYVKGVTSGDYDRDGWTDLYVSTLYGRNYLFRNEGVDSLGVVQFRDITEKAGLDQETGTFSTWFWDYNQDGWQDILVAEFEFYPNSPSTILRNVVNDMVQRESAGGRIHLFRNNKNGTFEDVSTEAGLNKSVYAMGSNFGDFDNDGYQDLYLGTGDPNLYTIIPNRAFLNLRGEKFREITYSANLGHIQKGHAISFGDVDHDGDQDIYAVLGGAFTGDLYPNALFQNQNRLDKPNNWIKIKLEGITSNRAAIGSELYIKTNLGQRIYRCINSGSSFGASALRQEIGIGQGIRIDTLKIKWAGTSQESLFTNVKVNQFIMIRQGDEKPEPIDLTPVSFQSTGKMVHH
ncbi:MAG: CRTAC1 family protein [Candidatus Cyclobacteriaceae bacterium M3_2C_046]